MCCAEKNRCICDKSVWENLTPLEKKLSCERSEYALCTLMNKYKKKDCYKYMPPLNDGASDIYQHGLKRRPYMEIITKW